jgi:hypothetical protein
MGGRGLSRRELIAAGAAAGTALGLPPGAAGRAGSWERTLDFTALTAGSGWPRWRCPGVANLRRTGEHGLLEAGSDVFPCDPRPVAFALDSRSLECEIQAELDAGGAGAGVVLRRVGPRRYYAAVLDSEKNALVLLRRDPDGVTELGRETELQPGGAVVLSLRATSRVPTRLEASLRMGGRTTTVTATDATRALQRPGDPGVLATARTLYPSAGPEVLPALGNLHLLPYGVQEGQAVIGGPIGQVLLDRIKERSTARLRRITIRGQDGPQPTRPSAIASVAGAPLAGGAILRVAADVPARVEIEVSRDPEFRRSRRLPARRTGPFDSVLAGVRGLPGSGRVYWRAHLRRRGKRSVGPTRSFRPLPSAGSTDRARIAVGSCAAQFGPIFGHLADREPDAFVWQGDLNYSDTVGPLAQTIAGYAGIWRDFLANPAINGLLERSMLAVQRDDHDYGIQDANASNLVPWGLRPWEALMERRTSYRFSAGLADFWVLDQRLHKSNPEAPDTPEKTLLGRRQRRWLLRTLAASKAPFKVICTPCTLAPVAANARDGSWAEGFRSERDLLLAHIERNVSGQTIFVAGDTHWTLVYEGDGIFEARPCPLGIPTPNDITLTQPQAAEDARSEPGVLYADDTRGHFALLDVAADRGGKPRLDLSLVRDDGQTAFSRSFG